MSFISKTQTLHLGFLSPQGLDEDWKTEPDYTGNDCTFLNKSQCFLHHWPPDHHVGQCSDTRHPSLYPKAKDFTDTQQHTEAVSPEKHSFMGRLVL